MHSACLKLLRLAKAILATQNLFLIHMDPFKQRKNLERFGELVLADRGLHEKLRATVGAETFAALAVQLGAEHGCVFTAEIVRAALNERRRAWLGRWIM
jgi:hypothetical protein